MKQNRTAWVPRPTVFDVAQLSGAEYRQDVDTATVERRTVRQLPDGSFCCYRWGGFVGATASTITAARFLVTGDPPRRRIRLTRGSRQPTLVGIPASEGA